MNKRTPLASRVLPNYLRGEEIMNMVTHIAGVALGLAVLVLCSAKAAMTGKIAKIVSGSIYGFTMIALYTMSSVYHGLKTGMAKKVLQVIDHCAIYFLIAGTYTPIALCAIAPVFPVLGWSLLSAQWLLAIFAATLTAIDLHNYRVFSMICYILTGWSLIFFLPQAITSLTLPGFQLVLTGGIIYTIGAVLYGLGSKLRWMHSIFHIFVVLGSLSQFLAIFFYVL